MKRIPIIKMSGVTKSFPGVIANNDISFRVYPGEIHALLGENGAGKSTLMSILAGLYRPDNGTIKVQGKPVQFRSPRFALEAGIGMIYQHFRLVNNFTAAENIVLGAPGINFSLQKDKIEQEVRELSRKFGLEVNPSARVSELSLGEQQRVEILKMLYRGCEILIMDEPTTVLTPQEVKELFKILRLMTEQGKGIVLITHKLHEVMEIADYVTVLRRGQVVGEDRIENLDAKTLTAMMVAREVEPEHLEPKKMPGQAVFKIKNFNVRSGQGYMAVKDANLEMRQGEILAIAGVAGNGQTELVEALAGLRSAASGQIIMDDEDITRSSVKERLARGISFVPEDRIGMGLVPNLSIMDNAILRTYAEKDFSAAGFLNHRKISAYTQKLVESYNIFLADINHPINYLSGGNLQKLLLAREIDRKPKVLIASYPVRGLDVAAAEAVFKIILAEREKGTAVLLVIEDLEDIFRLADRVAVMYEGRIRTIMNVEDADIEKIGAYMLGAGNMGVENA